MDCPLKQKIVIELPDKCDFKPRSCTCMCNPQEHAELEDDNKRIQGVRDKFYKPTVK